MRRRRFALAWVSLIVFAACGGASSRLITVKTGSGSGPVAFEVSNQSGVAINSLYWARSDQVSPELDPESPDGQKVWGPDALASAIPRGERVPVPVPSPGRWDVRATDREDRFQHVSALKLDAGGRYILELREGGWRHR